MSRPPSTLPLITPSFKIYRTRVSAEEMRTGVPRPDKDLPFYQALNDPDTRAEYIRRETIFKFTHSLEANQKMSAQTSSCYSGGARTFLPQSSARRTRFLMASDISPARH